MNGWQFASQVSVPGGGSATVVLPSGRPVFEKFTVWAISDQRTLTNMSCQPRINTKNSGAATAFVAVLAADPIYNSAATGLLLPHTTAGVPDPVVFDVVLTNAGVDAEAVTIYFVAIGRNG